ncbi:MULTISPECIES: type VII secretion-associated serine protease mycosin [unclassified Streptomyces]|uniref:type VII secretion-associated serine protease mycosin n=1 Tax=unclassified Streptomyces TaxID=2593676 RepID=UPI00224E7E59|nr:MULTISPECIES: type VII secretion-associated serine protease mycosin [unclassified Streptomyces]MCX5139114.1 type VII secretion-associated serine protease mycosin [Streptomyces sp. NBC_00338]WRZ63814.1 type VII secretion-associated serine protease mycosin [Streptomyces sp. NBC_01257]WSU57778.1 type VII secretion-associated serine protease mycosin [Streptomyces sp. NBC_01104]
MSRRARPRRLLGAVCAATAFALLPAVPAGADTIRAEQWGLDALHTDRAWQTTRGKGITVAVVDTGVDGTVPDLVGQVLPGKDLIGFGAGRGDRSWARHGTAMAGIIAGRGHGTGREAGVIGIAPEARILPVRVILEATDPARAKARKTRGTALADGIRWAADHGADVINLSLGDDSESAHPEPDEDAAVQYALKKGAVVVASSGNGGEKGDHISYPAAYPGVIAVAAVDRYGTHASFSTRRWYATVSAPGDHIVVPAPDRKYYVEWGTSAASAFVSGAVALVRAAHPGLSPAQIRKLLTDTARSSPPAGRDDARGYGIVDPAAAIEAGGALRPEGLRTDSSATGYRKQYFGTGPAPEREDDGPAGWLAPAAGGLGAVLLALAVVLWRGRGGRPPAFRR